MLWVNKIKLFWNYYESICHFSFLFSHVSIRDHFIKVCFFSLQFGQKWITLIAAHFPCFPFDESNRNLLFINLFLLPFSFTLSCCSFPKPHLSPPIFVLYPSTPKFCTLKSRLLPEFVFAPGPLKAGYNLLPKQV